ncbi:hypothetical protein CEXT_485311 [Caerostris extrusa]|uniref:Secreted protein n=1 Tax=Caerostris extrusa TaxID=172846 RepID=A0AAV4TNW1_CAEEX|nr:hypothetical protein CEXT_485311 [Caerostris extrusa]
MGFPFRVVCFSCFEFGLRCIMIQRASHTRTLTQRYDVAGNRPRLYGGGGTVEGSLTYCWDTFWKTASTLTKM